MKQIRIVSLIAATLLSLAGCGAQLTKLDDGRFSALTADDNALRLGLLPHAPARPLTITYHPAPRCSYKVYLEAPGQPIRRYESIVTARPIADKIQMVWLSDALASNFLIDRNGHLYYYNTDVKSGNDSLVNTDNEIDFATKEKANFQATSLTGAPSAHVVNAVTIMTPEYIRSDMRIGDIAAIVHAMDDNRPWATYRFMGVSSYRGTPVAVLDLETRSSGFLDEGPVLVGFSLIDMRTASPLLMVMHAGTNAKSEQISCGFR